MRILLINPPNCGRSIPEERYGISSIKQIFRGEPLALEMLAGNLVDHEVRILDLKVEPNGLQKTLVDFSPQLVGLTAMTCEANSALKLARTIREQSSATIVIGGSHASNVPEDFNRPEIDWIAIGLGTQSLHDLVEGIASAQTIDIPGMARSTPGRALCWTARDYTSADLVCPNRPRYDLVDHYRPSYTLQSLGLQMGLVASAAGCPYDCNFCCIGPVTGKRYLTAPTEHVVAAIDCLTESPVIRLVDANSFGNRVHALQLAEAIARAGISKQYLADVRADTVVNYPELLRQWKEIGLRAVVIGFEEITDRSLTSFNKQSNAATSREAIAILHQLGITIVGDFIISPDYTEENFDKLAGFVDEQCVELPMYTVLTPLPGTRLHQQLKARITVDDLDYYTLTNSVMATRLPEEIFYQRYADLLARGHRNARV
ncbi:MAG: B12-binding domain-containing radical SAM protein [Desulfuromonas sp.]|nr:MAG: B12-binding domain-containing radical SAM protein [Desulfuromonas sp.]